MKATFGWWAYLLSLYKARKRKLVPGSIKFEVKQ